MRRLLSVFLLSAGFALTQGGAVAAPANIAPKQIEAAPPGGEIQEVRHNKRHWRKQNRRLHRRHRRNFRHYRHYYRPYYRPYYYPYYYGRRCYWSRYYGRRICR